MSKPRPAKKWPPNPDEYILQIRAPREIGVAASEDAKAQGFQTRDEYVVALMQGRGIVLDETTMGQVKLAATRTKMTPNELVKTIIFRWFRGEGRMYL